MTCLAYRNVCGFLCVRALLHLLTWLFRAQGGGAGAAKPSSPELHDQEETDDQRDGKMNDETDDEKDGEKRDAVGTQWSHRIKIEYALRYQLTALRSLVLFPLDTIKTRLQATNSEQLLTSGRRFDGLYDGLGPELVRAAVFFALDSRLMMQLTTHLRIPVRWKVHEVIKFAIGVPLEVTEAAVNTSQKRSSNILQQSSWRSSTSEPCLCLSHVGGKAASAGGLGQDVAVGRVVSHGFQGAHGLVHGLGGNGSEGHARV
jgi:hypothetical protein